MSDQDASAKILQKVRELARGLGRDTTSLRSADIIPTSGILDSAKANRSRSSTGHVRWLNPMTTMGILGNDR